MVDMPQKSILVTEVLCPICKRKIPYNKTIHSIVTNCRIANYAIKINIQFIVYFHDFYVCDI